MFRSCRPAPSTPDCIPRCPPFELCPPRSIRIPTEVSLHMLIYVVTCPMLPRTRPSPARPPQEACPQFISEESCRKQRATRGIPNHASWSTSAPVEPLRSERRASRMPYNRPLLCFHIVANSFCRNPLRLTLMQTARGVGGSRPIIVSQNPLTFDSRLANPTEMSSSAKRACNHRRIISSKNMRLKPTVESTDPKKVGGRGQRPLGTQLQLLQRFVQVSLARSGRS